MTDSFDNSRNNWQNILCSDTLKNIISDQIRMKLLSFFQKNSIQNHFNNFLSDHLRDPSLSSQFFIEILEVLQLKCRRNAGEEIKRNIGDT